MILCDREVLAAISRKAIRITPLPDPDGWSSTALDLTLAAKLQVWRELSGKGAEVVINPRSRDFNVTALADEHTSEESCAGSNGYHLRPGGFVLGWTVQKIQLPHTSRIAARVEGKSSLARLGLGVHITAPTIHAGFGYREAEPGFPGNPIQLEIWNFGPLTIKLTEGLPICQLILEEVHGTPDQGYKGQFALQGPDVASGH